MTATVNGKRKYISELNKIFFLFTAIKILFTFLSPLFVKAIEMLFEVCKVKDPEAVVTDIFSDFNPTYILFNISFYILSITIPTALFFALRKGHDASDHKFLTGRPPFLGTVYAVGSSFGIVFLFSFASALISDFLSRKMGINLPVSETVLSTDPKIFPLYICFFCILPSLSEEFLTRGILMRSLKKMGTKYAIIISSLAFMLMHDDVTSFPFTLISGLCIAFFSSKYNSVWVGCIIHFCLNINSTILSILSENASTEEGYFIFIFYFSAIFIISWGFMMFNLIKRFIFIIKKSAAPSEKPTYSKTLLLRSPFFYIFILTSVICAIQNIIDLIK